MVKGRFGSYWNKTETYEALQVYIDLNEDGLRDAVVRMMGGGRQKIDTGTFQNDMTTFTSADDVMTLLVHLGYLGYDGEQEEVFIPNNEVLQEYVNATKQGDDWQLVSQAVRASDALLQAVFDGRADDVASGVAAAMWKRVRFSTTMKMPSVIPCPWPFTVPEGITISFVKCLPERALPTWSLCRGRSMGINRL